MKPYLTDLSDEPRGTSSRVAIPRDTAVLSSASKIHLRPSDWVRGCVCIKDGNTGFVKSIDLGERRYLRRVYDTPSNRILLLTSRQTEKSTTLGNMIFSVSALRQNYGTLFVSPSATQTAVFSRTRIDDIIDISPRLKALTHRSKTMNLTQKTFINGSVVYLRSAFLSADRIRGISVNAVFGDEFQDLLSSVVPVIVETTSHHKNPKLVWSGTPKTLDNTIEVYWSKHSTQSEWVIPCEKHGTPKDPKSWHWNILGEKNVGKFGPICDKCGAALNPEHPLADWHQMNPGAQYEGFRICRLMVPWFYKDPAKWKEILQNKETFTKAQYMNEVLALSYDSGQKPLSTAEMRRASVESKHADGTYKFDNDEDSVAKIAQAGGELFAGIDWGGGGVGENSFTALSVGGYVGEDGRWQVVFKKRYDGLLLEPEPQIADLIRLIRKFRIKYVGTDFGGGFVQNKALSSAFGAEKVHSYQYQGRMQGKVIYKPALHRSLVFRSAVMADYISAIKTGKILFPAWEVYRKLATDYTSLTSRFSETQRMQIFDKVGTDDCFHAGLYSLLVSLLVTPRPDIFQPIQNQTPDERQADEAETQATIEMTSMVDEYDPGYAPRFGSEY